MHHTILLSMISHLNKQQQQQQHPHDDDNNKKTPKKYASAMFIECVVTVEIVVFDDFYLKSKVASVRTPRKACEQLLLLDTVGQHTDINSVIS